MAKLLKLQLSGIRGFGQFEDQTQLLKFDSPLTLIVGQNGCGKTTLIEAIKYVCSGDLPAGTNGGQGFVNDPKMSGSASAKGQIKLKLSDTHGNEITVCRVVDVIQTASSLKFTNLSNTIRIVAPDGTVRSISNRCADITAECCQILNVSAPVLNNVIFCHQENCAWPLDEGKKLKEKFDEIFEVQRYNKCTEELRKQHKSGMAKLKTLQIELEYKKEKKDDVEKKHRQLRDKENRLQAFEDVLLNKNRQLVPIQKRIDEIHELEKGLSELNTKLAAKEATRSAVVNEQNTIRRSLAFEFEGDDAQLLEKIKSFRRDQEKEEELVEQLEQRKIDVESKTRELSQVVAKAQSQLGELSQQKSQWVKKCEQRNEMIRKAKDKMQLNIEQDWDESDDVTPVMRELEAAVECLEDELKMLIATKDTEEAKLQKEVDNARESVASMTNDVKTKKAQLVEYETKLTTVTEDLLSQTVSDEVLKNCTKRLEQIDHTIHNLKFNFKESQENQKTASYKKEISDKERTLEILEDECKKLRQNDVVEGKIESEKHLIMEKQTEIVRLRTKHSDNFKQLFDGVVPEKNLKEMVHTIHTKADFAVKNLMEKINKKQKEVTTLEVQKQNQVDKIAACEKELKEKQRKISQACNGTDFNETLNTSLQRKERLQHDKGQYSSIKVIFAQYVQDFEKESPCCPICETKFKQNGDVVRKIIATLKNKLEVVPEKLSVVEKQLKTEETRYDQLQQLKTTNREIDTLQKETLPQLRNCLKEIEENLSKTKAELESLKIEQQTPAKKMEISKAVISDVGALDQNQNDMDKCKTKISTLQRELVRVSSKKSKDEVEAEVEALRAEVSELRMKVENQVNKLNGHRDRLHKLMEDRNAVKEKESLIKDNLKNKPILEAQQAELKEKTKILQEDILELEASLDMIKTELQDAIKTKECEVAKNKYQIEAERDKVTEHKELVQSIKHLQKEVESYKKNELDEEFSTTEEHLKTYKANEQTLEKTKTKILAAIAKKRENLAKQELNFQTLKNNQILREKKAFEASLEQEVLSLKEKIGGHNCKTVFEEKGRLIQEYQKLDKEINNITGEKTGLMTNIEEIRIELDKHENKTAHDQYMKKFYEVKLTKIINQDLVKFALGLEMAVLEFHKSKMSQINKNIQELWKDVYRGNDIEYIEIKANQSLGSATTSRRSYSYKVVQVKKGVELDMRGRCSAGQKVLACLIIRIALAEALSANCGILALDEPTTNLDKENVESLAETLSRIVTMRQREKNFQLLVISHDEEFVRSLSRGEGMSHFYRVHRDDKGFSRILKETNF